MVGFQCDGIFRMSSHWVWLVGGLDVDWGWRRPCLGDRRRDRERLSWGRACLDGLLDFRRRSCRRYIVMIDVWMDPRNSKLLRCERILSIVFGKRITKQKHPKSNQSTGERVLGLALCHIGKKQLSAENFFGRRLTWYSGNRTLRCSSSWIFAGRWSALIKMLVT